MEWNKLLFLDNDRAFGDQCRDSTDRSDEIE